MLKLSYKRSLMSSFSVLTLLENSPEEDVVAAEEGDWSVQFDVYMSVSTSSRYLQLLPRGSVEEPNWCECYTSSLPMIAALVARCNKRKNVMPTGAAEGLLY